jgi:hypothetical protein
MHHPTLRSFTHIARLSLICLTTLLLALTFSAASPAHAAGETSMQSGSSNGANRANAFTGVQLASLPTTGQSVANSNQLSSSCTTEGFDTVLPTNWVTTNNSNPVGRRTWFTGDSWGAFPSHSGATSSYIAVNFDSTGNIGTISNWLITPEWSISTGDTLTFYTRTATNSFGEYPDRLQVRLSTNGASTDVGGNESSVGDFSTLLLDINPTLIRGVYPKAWAKFTVNVPALPSATTGRFAFRYFVTNAGSSGSNSDYIGIDTVRYGCERPGYDSDPTPSSTIDFGNTVVQTSASKDLSISETDSSELRISSLVLSGTNAADFSISPNTAFSISDGGPAKTVTITCTPSASGTRVATLTITHNASSSPAIYDLLCTGLMADMIVSGNGVAIDTGDSTPALTDGTEFGIGRIDHTITRTFTIVNNGTALLGLSGTPRVAVGGMHPSDFTVTQQPASSVAITGSTTFDITFAPTGEGLRSAIVSIASNDANKNPYTFMIQGEVTGPISNVAPVAAAGSDQFVDTDQVVTLNGSGSSDANGDSLTYGWMQTGGPVVSLSDATAISPTFTSPAASTVLTFTLTVTDSFGVADATPDDVVVTVINPCSGYTSPYTVPAGDSAALSQAITCANKHADANVINLTNSTYSFTGINNTDPTYGSNALPPITSPITITGNGATLARASGAPDFRLLTIDGGTATLDHVTLTGGIGGLGGGIRNTGTLTLTHSTVISNTANDAGGIRNEGMLTLIDSTITQNTASGVGGGIDNTGTLQVIASTISGNAASAGGGIRNERGSTISDSSIVGNSASALGGGIYTYGGLTITNSTITGNTVADGFGGGGIANANQTTVLNSTIAGNTAAGTGGGGGILNLNGSLTAINTLLSGNSAPNGGGLHLYGQNGYPGGAATLTNVTLAGNNAASAGGGILLEAGTLTVTNSIVWGNRAAVAVDSITATNGAPTVNHSLVEGGSTGTGNRSSDPQFVSQIDADSAPTSGGDYHLESSSPAINQGDAAALPADQLDLDGDGDTSEPLPFDRDGNARVADGNVDMGAFEWQGTLVPTLTQPPSLTILEGAGVQTVQLTGIGSAASNAAISITASSSNPALIADPAVSYTSPSASGSLSFTPVANANGTTTITVTVQASSGDPLTRSFTVTVTPVNDAPSFTAGPNQTVDSSAGVQTVLGWASGFSAGPADEASQTLLGYSVVGNTNSELFTVAPAIHASGTLTYTPKPGARGTAIISVVVHDSGGTANGGVDTSTARTFMITIGGSSTINLPLVLR